jgi:predicted nucleic acid-binding protein
MIIDTMVFAYSLLKVEGKCEEATQALAQSNIIVVPDSLRVELANVVWQWVKYRDLSQDTAYAVLEDAEALIEQVINSERLWARALQLSIQKDHPAYDTLFVAAAELLNDRMVSYDEKMQKKFSDQVFSPARFLSIQED